jgi:hypothetical protein
MIPFSLRLFSGAILAGAGLALAQAQVTWQTTHTTNGGFNQGQASIARDELFVTVHPGYLDVEEEVEIATAGTVTAGNDANTLEINGDFSLPAEATVVGLLLWDGNTVLEAKLLSKSKADSLYQAQVDRNSTPPVRPRDPILLSLTSPGNYHFSVYPVKIDESRRFRLRYHLPPHIGPNGLTIPLDVAFAKYLGESKVQVHLTSADKVDSITWAPGTSPRRLGLPRNVSVTGNQLMGAPAWSEYDWMTYTTIEHAAVPGVEVRPVDPLYQAAFTTSLAEGQMQGKYLHLYSQVPTEAFNAAGMRMEIAVLWKWHNPHTWLQSDYYYGYYNQQYVYQAENQARQLENLYGMLQPQGASIGLVHNDGRNATKTFVMSGKQDSGYTQALQYLGQWNTATLQTFASKAAAAFVNHPTTAKQRSAEAVQTFTSDIRLVRTLYSPDKNVVRHLILVSAGPSADLEDLGDLNAIMTDAFKGQSLSVGQLLNQDFQYPGFDMWTAKKDFPLSANRLVNGVAELPTLADFTTTATLRNGNNAYDQDIQCYGAVGVTCGTLVWHGKSQTEWKPEIEWQLHDALGKPLALYKQTTHATATENDTGLAVLWAGSASPFSENREPPLGPVYGFVDRSASLLALAKDTLKAAQTQTLPNGSVPRIENADILAVIPNYNANTPPGQGGDGGFGGTAVLSALGASQNWQLTFNSRTELVLHIPGLKGWQGMLRLRLIGVDGKQIKVWNVSPDSQGKVTLKVPMGTMGLHVLRIEAQGFSVSKSVVIP